ncbi:hypothetical protein DYB30_007748 [Aphanomyces astaci]|uniref:Uncharacterized protein n=1 Tax=Aphanomyces astaci TaxID=112090 RepID=A0A397EAD4_APHAT|nr:hypothetical protein DYB30_007748 [Aphanomyces astaci]
MAFSQAMVDKRVTLNTKKENNSNWSKVVSWRQDNPEYAHDPRLTRFARLPEAIFCYVGQLMLPDDAGNSPSMNVANKARAGISEFYKYNNDGYGTSSWCVKDGQGYGNPMTSPVVLGCFKGLQKEKKATQVTRRAAPMTKPMLKTLYAFLDHSNDTSKSFTLWFKAVTSLSCLKMLKWWGGWSEQDKCDVIMKYLLDSIYVAEEEVLADATSPDRKHLAGCPTTWIYSTHEQLSELVELVAPNEDGEQLAMANV